MSDTIERARGRWREIMLQVGIGAQFLVKNKHQPCPMCGGKDRYRWRDDDGSGNYYCNQCGPGMGMTLVAKFKKLNFREACDLVDGIIGAAARTTGSYVQQPQSEDGKRRDALQKLLGEATDDSVVSRYLTRRGLQIVSAALLGNPECLYYDEEAGRLRGRFPAVLAPIHGPNGDLVSVQRIYDADVTPRKKTMSPVGTINGAAVRLWTVEDEMGVAEGVETALAAYVLFGIPTWAALSTNGLETFMPPQGIHRLHIFGDADENFEGQASAMILARRLNREAQQKKRPLIECAVNLPDRVGTDWLDVLNERR